MQAIEFVVDETAGNRTPEKAMTNGVFEEAKKRFLLIGKGDSMATPSASRRR